MGTSSKLCTMEGCAYPRHGRGLCHVHYNVYVRGHRANPLLKGSQGPRPWDFGPLMHRLAISNGVMVHETNGCPSCEGQSERSTTKGRHCMTNGWAAELFGVNITTILRWRLKGLTDQQADVLAVRSGVHPSAIWGWRWFEAALEASVA